VLFILKLLNKKIKLFLLDPVINPLHAAIAAGTYPLLYFYNSNFILINSWEQFVFIFFIYILLPILLFYIFKRIIWRIDKKNKFKKYLIPILNIVWFVLMIILRP